MTSSADNSVVPAEAATTDDDSVQARSLDFEQYVRIFLKVNAAEYLSDPRQILYCRSILA